MKRLFKIAVLAALLTVAGISGAGAQEFAWDVGFDFRFDNREYGNKGDMIAPSETLFGAFLRPVAGVGWGQGHSIMAGISCPTDFGSGKFMGTPEFLAYYNYSTDRVNVTAGIFPRSKSIGKYSYAFFSDSTRFYDANFEGLLLQYIGRNGYAEIGCDWNSLYSPTNREKFMLFFASRIHRGLSYAGLNATMYHHAGSGTVRGVVDNILTEAYIGLDLAGHVRYEKLYVQIAWLQAYQNDRKYVGKFVKPGGTEIEFGGEYKSFGLRNIMYSGGNLMPYYDSPYENDSGAPYACGLYFGDTFYRTGGNRLYERFELYYEPLLVNGVRLRISSVHHFDGIRWGWQQAVSLKIDIDNAMFCRTKPTDEQRTDLE